MSREKKEIIAMLLAGGQGSRLNMLTEKIAKPAVPFGGKYRIIDFTLSNCSNSGINTIGVLTQYRPLELNNHIGIGTPWDLDRKDGGVTILAPFMGAEGGRWFRGTANAIFENFHFIEQYDPEYVLILSGDHIYKMDYSLMLDYHKEKSAEATIAVINVPWEETHKFGIMNIDVEGKIIEFEEKPKKAKSNLASMGIYIFNWKTLKKYLMEDELDKKSHHDFGKNIIPNMLKNGRTIYSYVFKGYWKDVGEVKSLWESNMDLLKEDDTLNLYDPNWKIYSRNPVRPPHYISTTGKVKSSLLNEGCIIYGEVNNCVLFPGVVVGENSIIVDSVIMPGVKIGENVSIRKSIIMSNVIIPTGTVIEGKDDNEITLVNQ
ncbi:MAG: glucose-1-phosphate adenylyltransferase [Clostridiales bacterium GWB2_37_7]|nr:MAG: glucose-1-phosphate adenylyltransferase [Clostridiales bacterium GWB2_37_7]